MKHLNVEIQSLILRLRRKYKNNNDYGNNKILDYILWYSIPIVYPNYRIDSSVAISSIKKQSKRRWRYRKYVKGLVLTADVNNLPCFLVSLTFSDSVLDSTESSSRKQYVSRYLKSVSEDYFACIDFGKQKGREHYHAIISTSLEAEEFLVKRRSFFKFKDSCFDWSYGFMSLRKIKTDEFDIYKTLNYALKASNYAYKSADSGIKPFHKAGVTHIELVENIEELPY